MIRKTINVTVLSLVIILAALAPILASCSGNQRKSTIKATFVTLNATFDGFAQWDTGRQDKIIAEAPSFEEGQAKLATYREGSSKIYAGIRLAYKILLAAATSDDDRSLADALRESTKLAEQINTFKDQLK